MGFCRKICGIFVAMLAYPLCYWWMPPLAYEIKGKCAVVTGTSSGLGIEIAKALAAEGVSKLILTARRVDKLTAVAEEISKAYPATSVFPVKHDVSKDEDNKNLFTTAMKKFGSCPIILVNNAGVESWVHYHKTSKQKIDAMLDINVKGVLHLTHDFLPAMIKSGGHIVTIGSVSGKVSTTGMGTYSATKFAVLGFMQGLRAEMRLQKYPVTAHTVMPGFVKGSGMAADMVKETGIAMEDCTDTAFGWSWPQDTGAAVVGSIKYDHPEWIVNNIPVRMLALLREAFPRLMDVLFTIPIMDPCRKFMFKVMDAQT